MARSRKTNRVPVQASAFDDAVSITSAGSTSTLPPHRRQSSVTSTPPTNDRAAAKPAPHLRALSSHPAPPEETTTLPTRPKAAESAPPPPKETPPTNFARNNPYACTFPDCKRVFKSLGLLKQHKASDDAGHDYCKVCDLDFEDDDALHMHKIGSEKHICCEVCSEDFSSESGRDRHMRQVRRHPMGVLYQRQLNPLDACHIAEHLLPRMRQEIPERSGPGPTYREEPMPSYQQS